MRARHVFLAVVASAAVLIATGFLLEQRDDGARPAAPDETTPTPVGHVRWTAVASELGVSGAPRQITTVGDDLFVVRIDGSLWGFDAVDGAVRWSRELMTGLVSRTVGDVDLVPVTTLAAEGVAVTALDRDTGLTRWVAGLPELEHLADLEAPSDAAAEGNEPGTGPRVVGTPGNVLVRTPQGGLHGLDRTTGERRWSENHPGVIVDADRDLALLIEPPPEQVHDPLDRPPDDAGPGVLRAVGQSDGAIRWSVELPTGAADTGLMAVIVPDGDIIAADGDGAVRGYTRGGELSWERTEIRRGSTLALAVAADTIVTQDRSRMFIGLEADTGFVRWRHDWLVPGPTALLTAERRAVVLSADDQLAVLGVDHGTRIWEEGLPTDAAITAGDDIVLIADRRGRLTGFDVARGAVRWEAQLPLGGRLALTADDDGNLYWRSPVRGAVASPDPLDGRQRWMSALSGASAGEPRVEGERLVMHHATVPDDWRGRRAPGTVVSSLDRDSGETAWEVATEPDAASDDDTPSPAAAAVERDRVVVAVGRSIRALTFEEGDERWTATLEHPVAVGPVRVGDTAVVADRLGVLHAVGLDEGDDRWSTTLDGRVEHLVGREDATLIVTTDTGTVARMDGRTGTMTWSAELDTVASHRPTVAGGGGAGETVLVAVGGAIVGLDADDGSERWRTGISAPLSGSPGVIGATVVIATTDGTLTALDAADGRMVEQHILRPIGAGPVVGGSMTYVVSVDGEIHALAPDDVADEWPLPPIGPR